MPPRESKVKQASDKTFGLKNKNKSKKVRHREALTQGSTIRQPRHTASKDGWIKGRCRPEAFEGAEGEDEDVGRREEKRDSSAVGPGDHTAKGSFWD